MTSNIVTTDHDEIRRWAEKRGGRPARVIGIDFPGEPADEDLEEISWAEFFERFERKKLAFCYQEEVWLH
jgi:hypothetical protein